jgi:hypothetical protein
MNCGRVIIGNPTTERNILSKPWLRKTDSKSTFITDRDICFMGIKFWRYCKNIYLLEGKSSLRR